MREELSLRLAACGENAESMTTSQLMSRANEIHHLNFPEDMRKPFANVDIIFMDFLDFMKAECSDRERKLVIISENLQRVWKTLHISIQTLGEKPGESEIDDIRLTHDALVFFGKENLVMDGLDERTVKIVKSINDGSYGKAASKRKGKRP